MTRSGNAQAASGVVALPRSAGDQPQETAVAVNPLDPLNAVVSFQRAVGPGGDHHPDTRVDFHAAWTADGGETWTVADAGHPGYRRSLDGSVAFDARGHAYLAYIAMDDMTFGTPTTRHGEFVVRSVDGGRTWEPPVALSEHPAVEGGAFDHIPHLCAGADGRVHVLWTRNLHGGGDELYLSSSTDGGATWSAERQIGGGGTVLNAAVADDGSIYAIVASFDPADPTPSWERGWEVTLLASADGGQTWAGPVPVVRPGPSRSPHQDLGVGSGFAFPRAFGWPVLALDPRGGGRLYVVWGDCRNGDRDVFCVASVAGGRTWSDAVRVNDDPLGDGADQLMQHAAVDPATGDLYVIFYDRRADPGNVLSGVTLARSSDGGRTFANHTWVETGIDAQRACLGDYIGLAAHSGRVYGAWVEDVPPEHGLAPQLPEVVVSGTMSLRSVDWPWGPAVVKVGLFRDVPW
jgi:hypothetical protein